MRRNASPLFVVATLVAFGCTTPTSDDRTSEPLVVTKYDTSVDFGSFSTFAISPTVNVVTDFPDAGLVAPSNGEMVVESVAARMEARGYTRVDASARPDLGMVVTALVKLKVDTSVYSGYWWGAPGYVAPPTFFGYPNGAYTAGWGYQSTAYKSGTLIIDMFDLKDPGRELPDAGLLVEAGAVSLESVWVGIGHGFVTLRASFEPTVLAVVDQAFLQSPYIRAQ